MDVSPLSVWLALAGKEDDRRDIDVLLMGIEDGGRHTCEISGCRGGDCRETVFDGVSGGRRRCCLIRLRP